MGLPEMKKPAKFVNSPTPTAARPSRHQWAAEPHISLLMHSTDHALAGSILCSIAEDCQALLPILDFSQAFACQVPSLPVSFNQSRVAQEVQSSPGLLVQHVCLHKRVDLSLICATSKPINCNHY
jgi:hypothetical protein